MADGAVLVREESSEVDHKRVKLDCLCQAPSWHPAQHTALVGMAQTALQMSLGQFLLLCCGRRAVVYWICLIWWTAQG